MQKVLTAAEMREVDRLTTEKYGIPSIILMENAAHAAARVIAEKLGGSVKGKSFLILCGKGNNGGDGAALARILAINGALSFVFLIGEIKETKGDASVNFGMLEKVQGKPGEAPSLGWDSRVVIGSIKPEAIQDFWQNLRHDSFDAVVDAILGTGLNKPLEESIGWLVEKLYSLSDFESEYSVNNGSTKKPLFFSMDIPSGLNADGRDLIGPSIKADLTVTFTSPKLANVLPPASNLNGELVIAEIGSPVGLIEQSPSQLFLAELDDTRYWLQDTRFSANSYKNKRGHSLIIAGSENYTGAAVLTADACMRSGVGLVTLAVPKSIKDSIASRVLPEVMTTGLEETENQAVSEEAFEQIEPLQEKLHCIAIGSGLSSNEETTRNFVRKVVENRKTPILIDADALNALSPFDIKGDDRHPLILTPHKGEMKRLLGLKDQDDLGDLVQLVREFVQKHNVILVLKGERVLIAEPGGKVVINPTGNSGLGKAGNGDTLAGILAGFITQAFAIPKDADFYDPPESTSPEMSKAFEAVIAAVYFAGLAGDIAEKKYGKRVMTASDVRECLVDAFNEIEKKDD